MSDNVTTVSYIREFGGTHSLEVNEIAREIWTWEVRSKVWLSAAHIPGVQNIEADECSRKFDHPSYFKDLQHE
jgi:hypothetical protein